MSSDWESNPKSKQTTWDDVRQTFDQTATLLGGSLPEIPDLLMGKVAGALGISDALNSEKDPVTRVTGAATFLQSAVANTASELHMLSGGIGELGATAGSLGAVAGLLSIGSLTSLQFGLLGLPYLQADDEMRAQGEKQGYLTGFAAGATYADLSFVRNELDVFRHFAGTAYEMAYREALWKGFHVGEGLSPEEKDKFITHVIDTAVQLGDKWSASSDDYKSMVYGIANTVTHEIALHGPDALILHAGPEHGSGLSSPGHHGGYPDTVPTDMSVGLADHYSDQVSYPDSVPTDMSVGLADHYSDQVSYPDSLPTDMSVGLADQHDLDVTPDPGNTP